MRERSEIEKLIARSVRENSVVFLRRAVTELVTHNDQGDAPLSQELATVVTVFTQTALELALASYLISTTGIRSILESANKMDDQEIMRRWSTNGLQTKRFEDNKKAFSKSSPGLYSVFEGTIDDFQKIRNKVVHFYFNFGEGDLYDLKYDVTYLLVHVVSQLLLKGNIDLSMHMEDLFPGENFGKLIKFPPYVHNVANIAADFSSLVLTCPSCEQVTFSNIELKCFACTYEDEFADLVMCNTCSKWAVIYDHLNIAHNESVPAKCLHCGHRSRARRCKNCKMVSEDERGMFCGFCDTA